MKLKLAQIVITGGMPQIMFCRIKSKIASKYSLPSQPRLVDIIAAVPQEYKKVRPILFETIFCDVAQIDCTIMLTQLIAVCIYRYVITLGLWSKYDVHGHYFRFTVQILVNPCGYILFSPISTFLCY